MAENKNPFCRYLSSVVAVPSKITGQLQGSVNFVPCQGPACAQFVTQIGPDGKPIVGVNGQPIGTCCDTLLAASVNALASHIINMEDEDEDPVDPSGKAN